MRCFYCGKRETYRNPFYTLDKDGHKICQSCMREGYTKSALEIIEHNKQVDMREERRGMTDKKLTDEEIIKRLERCVKRGNRNYDTDIVLELIVRQKVEIEELRERISYLEKSIDCSRKEYNRLLQKLQQAKSEAIREFAERLKSKLQWDTEFENMLVFETDIKNVVKEMTEGE